MALMQVIITHSSGSIRNYIKRFLFSEFAEINISEAESGEAALNLMFNNHFDVVMVEQDLSDMSIDEFIKLRKRIEHYQQTPVIVFTSSDAESDLNSLKKSSIEHILTFPFPLKELKGIISSLVDLRKKRIHERFHIPGATALFELCTPEIKGDLINISNGGMLIEIPYAQQQLDLLGKNVIHLSFRDSVKPVEIKYITCKTAGMKVIGWNNDESPKRIRLSFIILDSPLESKQKLELILNTAKKDQLYEHPDDDSSFVQNN